MESYAEIRKTELNTKHITLMIIFFENDNANSFTKIQKIYKIFFVNLFTNLFSKLQIRLVEDKNIKKI